MKEQNSKKAKQCSNAALFSSILLIVFGFGFGVVNMAFFLIAIALAIFGLVKNEGNVRSVKIKCISVIVIVLAAIGFYLMGLHGLIDFIIKPW